MKLFKRKKPTTIISAKTNDIEHMDFTTQYLGKQVFSLSTKKRSSQDSPSPNNAETSARERSGLSLERKKRIISYASPFSPVSCKQGI